MTQLRDCSAGEWIAPRLGPFGGAVESVVPRGFDAYARVLHPVTDARGEPSSWTTVCEATGRQPHALMQWHAIAGATVTERNGVSEHSMLWDGDEPGEGNLAEPALTALFRLLIRHTDPDAECYCALWDGWGFGAETPAVTTVVAVRRPRWLRWLWPKARPGLVPSPSSFAVLTGPRLRHPGRDYLLFSGQLETAIETGFDVRFGSQSPNLFWPADRTWCVATEIDFDSTLVAGSTSLIDDVLTDPALEAWPVHPGDSLTHDGDTLNA
ncbi:MAG: hypothetical protein GEU97_21910 [Actinophytocola sp.]|nr:hypothetical protein [Actinophytocola sp.]